MDMINEDVLRAAISRCIEMYGRLKGPITLLQADFATLFYAACLLGKTDAATLDHWALLYRRMDRDVVVTMNDYLDLVCGGIALQDRLRDARHPAAA